MPEQHADQVLAFGVALFRRIFARLVGGGLIPAPDRRFRGRRVPTIQQLIEKAVDAGVKLYPCGMTIDVFGYCPDDFVPGVQSRLGSSDFLDFAKDANMTLFV